MSRGRRQNDTSANLGFEAKLWQAADALRNNMDAAEYKHIILGLIFLKYVSDTFEEHHAKLFAGKGDYAEANPEVLCPESVKPSPRPSRRCLPKSMPTPTNTDMSLTESIVEDVALTWFGELGCTVGHGPPMAPSEAEAEWVSIRDVALVGRWSGTGRGTPP